MLVTIAFVLFTTLPGLGLGHAHHDTEDPQEPFIGWTREDLDAKWGTDVSIATMMRTLIEVLKY